MDFSDESNDLKLAMEKALAEQRLKNAVPPDRFNENWRFGQPARHAGELISRMADAHMPNIGAVAVEGAGDSAFDTDRETREEELLMQTIGSDKILALHLECFGKGVCLFLEKSPETPITITYETHGLFCPFTSIIAAPGVKARIIERHITHGQGCLICARDIQAMEGAELQIELQETGSGESRAMNITNISSVRGDIRHLTQHRNHLWAREETVAEILESQDDASIRLYSANRLVGNQTLDQHTKQIHTAGRSSSDLLYKNVIDGHAAATFAGNIYVAPGAHHTNAYQANRNMMLSEQATANSLPGLEILADHVRCSHGSASAPMDREELFYLLSRGIPRREAQQLVAEGFLADVLARLHHESPMEA